MTVGSSEFHVFYKGLWLAHLQPRNPNGSTLFPSEFVFSELYNSSTGWDALLARYGGPGTTQHGIRCLQSALDDGDLELRKIESSPAGNVMVYHYDMTGVKFSFLLDDPQTFVVCGQSFSRHFRFSPAPASVSVTTSPTPVAPTPPAPTPAVSEDVPIEIGGYALRTFKVTGDGKLGSLYKSTNWEDGKAIAKCLASKRCKSSPGDGCACGLYGHLTLDELMKDYGYYAKNSVAVFAPEGATVIGPRGLKTAAARIVAYWCADPRSVSYWRTEGRREEYAEDVKRAYADQCLDAQEFSDIAEMLAAYKFPPSASCCENLMRLHPESRSVAGVAGVAVSLPSGGGWSSVAPLMSQATPAGVDVVKTLLGGLNSS